MLNSAYLCAVVAWLGVAAFGSPDPTGMQMEELSTEIVCGYEPPDYLVWVCRAVVINKVPGTGDPPMPPVSSDGSEGEDIGVQIDSPADPPIICDMEIAIPQPDPWHPIWDGHDSTEGVILISNCNYDPTTMRFQEFDVPEPAEPPPPPVDPRDLAIEAVRELKLPTPELKVGPDESQLAVNVWMWLWVEEQPPVSITVTAGAVSVTATATLSSVTWSSNEPVRDSELWAEPAGTPVVCTGAGSPPIAGYPAGERPPCGYVFRSRSTAERTGGSGVWTLTASASWAVEWSSNTRVSGSDVLTSTGSRQVSIGEWDTELVSGGN